MKILLQYEPNEPNEPEETTEVQEESESGGITLNL